VIFIMSLAVSQSPACLPDQTPIDVNLTDDPITAGKNSSKKKANEPKPAGHEDSTTASTWDAGISTQTTPSSKRTRSSNVQLQSVQVDHDDSDDDVNTTRKSGRTSTNTNAATTAQQMTQNPPVSTSALPHTSQRAQACLNTWNNIPYKHTAFAFALLATSIGIATYFFHNILKSHMNANESQNFLTGAVAVDAVEQLFFAMVGFMIHELYQDKR
jgi:hypothetical protein